MFDRKELVRIMEAGIWKNRASLENWRGLPDLNRPGPSLQNLI